MTRIEISGVRNISVSSRGVGPLKTKTISVRGVDGSDVDIVMSAGNTEFLREVLNEDADRGKN
jgi:hypothetical protein